MAKGMQSVAAGGEEANEVVCHSVEQTLFGSCPDTHWVPYNWPGSHLPAFVGLASKRWLPKLLKKNSFQP